MDPNHPTTPRTTTAPAPGTPAPRTAAQTASLTADGSTPQDATHPDVIAARQALTGLTAATLTNHHDVTEPGPDERNTRGYFVEPRAHGRVAVYWLEDGRMTRRDQMPHEPALDRIAEQLTHHGWTVERMLRSSQCVFAHRPPAG